MKVLDLDDYLEILLRKPGALPGATALARARALGTFTATHDALWSAARKTLGDASGTRTLVEVLPLHRHMAHADVLAGITAALSIGSISPDVVAVEACKAAAERATTPAGETTAPSKRERVGSLTERRPGRRPTTLKITFAKLTTPRRYSAGWRVGPGKRGAMVDQDGVSRDRLGAGHVGSLTALDSAFDSARPSEFRFAPSGTRPEQAGEAGVGELVATACVRIHHRDGTVVGSGFLVGPTLVATCAHVVADALGVDPGVECPPAGQLAIDFPMVRDTPTSRTAEVTRWVPIGADGDGDVALLRLSEPAPRGAVIAPVRRVEVLWGHRFRIFGFPEGRTDGVWSTGVIRGGQATGWFQLQGAVGDQPVRGGFSGSPVWDDRTGAVVGMTVAADRDVEVTTAYLIPVEQVLGLDPELLPSPYRGVEPFEEEHARFFFGRDPEILRLRAAVDRCPLVAVVGPSGAGKSSLVRAGLVPMLRGKGTRVGWVRVETGRSVFAALADAVIDVSDPGSRPDRRERDARRIGDALADPATEETALTELAELAAGAEGDLQVLALDQFEELVETTPDVARRVLMLLTTLTAPAESRLRVVFTARGLALDNVLAPSVAEALSAGTVLVGPMSRTQLREAIVRPAEHAPGLRFEDGLVDRILDDAGVEPGQLGLVEALLAQLWATRSGGALTWAAYHRAGGVAGALAAQAEQAATSTMLGEAGAESLRQLCCRLTTVGHDGRFVRCPVAYAELSAADRDLVPALVSARLLVVSGAGVELAHQALLEHWPRLRGWLADDREFLTWRAELDRDIQRWQAAGQDASALRGGAALEEARRWRRSRPAELTEAEIAYLRLCDVRHMRQTRRRRTVAGTIVALAAAVALLVTVTVQRGERINAQLAAADAVNLAAAAQARARDNPRLAGELALAAWRSDPHSSAAHAALATTYLALRGVQAVLPAPFGGTRISVLRVAGSGPTAMLALGAGASPLRVSLVADATGRMAPTPSADESATSYSIGNHGQYAYAGADGALWLATVPIPGRPPSPPRPLVPPGSPRATLAGFSHDDSRLGWWHSIDNAHGLLTVEDLATGQRHDWPIPVPAAGNVDLTTDPTQVEIWPGDRDQPGVVPTVYSLTTGSSRPLPPGDHNDGFVVSCDRTSTEAGNLRFGPMLDGPPTRTVTHNVDCFGYILADQYLLEQPLADTDGADLAWRATDLATGRGYVFDTPALNLPSLVVNHRINVLGLVPGAGGGAPTAFLATGGDVLRIATRPESEDSSSDVVQERLLTTPATGALLAYHEDGTLSTDDRATGQRLAIRPSAGPGGAGPGLLGDDGVWTLDPGGSIGQLTGYRVPDLATAVQIPLPASRPDRPGPQIVFGRVAADAAATTVVVLEDGKLSAWDAISGRPLGDPITLPDPPPGLATANADRHVWPRIGHPEQVLVSTPDQRLQLWDVPAKRMLAELPIFVDGADSVVADHDRLVAATPPNVLQVWDLARGQRSGPDIPADTATLCGLDADGRLVAQRATGQGQLTLEFYDLERGARDSALVTSRYSSGFAVRVQPGQALLDGSGSEPPDALALTPERWRGVLCGVLPARPSPDTRALLPPDIDPEQPLCPAG